MTGLGSAADLTWNERLLTGINAIDAQHKTLFNSVTLLQEAVQERSMIRTCYMLEQLSANVSNHFRDEEYAMRLHDFPHLTEHIREHRDFTNHLYWVRKACLSHEITGELLTELGSWLLEHVSKSDIDYVPYLTPDRCLLPMTLFDMHTPAGNTALRPLKP